MAPVNWDETQRTIITLGENTSNLIEAGPGTGKTAVACARVADLIEKKGLVASKIFLVSFTRTAIKELRDRIESHAENPVNMAGVQIITLDSFSWHILRGFSPKGPEGLFDSYNRNIENFVAKLKAGDRLILEYLEEFQHVIIDEGQDLVGIRAELAAEIIKNLDKSCGVTIFADSAQAIYGFTNDSEQNNEQAGQTIVHQIRKNDLGNFKVVHLDNVHRTTDKKLRLLYLEGRKRLLGSTTSDFARWKEMKRLIRECSHMQPITVNDEELKGKRDHLVLYRTRAEVLHRSWLLWRNGIEHKLRMSGLPSRVHPWIGRVLSENNSDLICKDHFMNLWIKKIGDNPPVATPSPEEGWSLLYENAGGKNKQVDIKKLRQLISADRPPIDFLVNDSDLPGPIIGTIHASKGREARCVHLFLPPDQFLGNGDRDHMTDQQVAEEERVLFVGATRAREILHVSEGAKMFAGKLDGKRCYKKPSGGNFRRQVEIGLVDDLEYVRTVDGSLGSDPARLQEWLWENASRYFEASAIYDREKERNVVYALKKNMQQSGNNDSIPVGMLSSGFSRDLWGISNAVARADGASRLKPASEIRMIYITGVTTVAIKQEQMRSLRPPFSHSGFFLAPVITGFPVVFFNQWRGRS